MLTLLLSLAAHADAPQVPECASLTPMFSIDGKNPTAGEIFAVTQGERTLLVTAHHLFGPALGLPAQLEGAQVAEKVASVVVKDTYTGATCGRSEKALAVAGAKAMTNGDNTGDMAIFELSKDTSVNRLASVGSKTVVARDLAEAAPKKGDTVYVIGRVPESDTKAWQAEVVEVAETGIYYQLADPKFGATSGTAVVTAEGKVVGMHLGAGAMDDGAVVGTAVPWTALKAKLEAAK